MKVWFDISNSPHINMFYDLIMDLESEGHEIIVTSRPLANTVALLDQKQIKHTTIGQHYGKNILKKIFGYPIRVFQLWQYLSRLKPDLAVSQSSFHSPVVAKILGIPSIYTNDNEHALGNILCFMTATRILIPEKMPIPSFFRISLLHRKFIRYPGIKEGIYLWIKAAAIASDRKRRPPFSDIEIFIRPEPLTAQYYNGKQNFLDDIISELQETCRVTVLARDKTQFMHYSQKRFNHIHLPATPLSFDQVAINCTLFIGAGGSMTRELALIGVPTISVYQSNLLDVDEVLISRGLMIHDPKLTAEKVNSYLKNIQNTQPSNELMDIGKSAYQLFKKEINTFCPV
jgi:predicted glycosyltransferase